MTQAHIYVDQEATQSPITAVRDTATSTAESVGNMSATATDDRFIKLQNDMASKSVKLAEDSLTTLDKVEKYTQDITQHGEDSAEVIADTHSTTPAKKLTPVGSGGSSKRQKLTKTSDFQSEDTDYDSVDTDVATAASSTAATSTSAAATAPRTVSAESLNGTSQTQTYTPTNTAGAGTNSGMSATLGSSNGNAPVSGNTTKAAPTTSGTRSQTTPTSAPTSTKSTTASTPTATGSKVPASTPRSSTSIPTQASKNTYSASEYSKAEAAVKNPRTAGSNFKDVVKSFSPIMQQVYPAVQQTSQVLSDNAVLRSDLESQRTGSGSQQPGTVHLTQEQARVLAEAIAHNINVKRQQEADAANAEAAALAGSGSGGAVFGGNGNFSPNLEGASDYTQMCVELAEQLVNAEPPIPYAWGGGHGATPGPTQGTTDGGYADVCGDYAKIGMDCSGLSRYFTAETIGVDLNGTAASQLNMCQLVSQPMIGDLGWPNSSNPGHVVVYMGNGTILEAQQSGTYLMFSPANPSYIWGRAAESPNWALEQEGVSYAY